MAYYSIFPQKDTTIYSNPDRDTLNTGNDEILELTKEIGSTSNIYYPSRILIQFSNSDIQTAISKANNFTSSLQLFSTEHKNLPSTQDIKIHPIYRTWNEGTGRYSNYPSSSNGCSWLYKDNSTLKTLWLTSNFPNGTTGSINSPHLTTGGGEWYTGSGFEADISSSNGTLNYFSVDTHTIFPPKLTFKWDDSNHPGALVYPLKTSGELNVSLYKNKDKYNVDEEATIRLNVRDKYPTRTFTTSSNYLNPGYFTTSSYYSIRDAHTEEIIIPFDTDNTKLSADSKGMYFKVYMNSLQPERYYRLLFKHINNDGIEIFDNDYHFKVVR